MGAEQKKLASSQVEAFYHDQFVQDQVQDFGRLVGDDEVQGTVLDIGGGCGFFARSLSSVLRRRVRVLDADNVSVAACREHNVDAILGDALTPEIRGDEKVVCFNLILHHLVGPSDASTKTLQKRALSAWHDRPVRLFINEYIYESYFGNISGRLIFSITSSAFLSALAKLISIFIPSFRANTFGVGVRFRSHNEWIDLFREAGFKVSAVAIGQAEHVASPLRMLLIREIRRDSYLLEPGL